MDRQSGMVSNVRIVRAGDWVRATPEGNLDRPAAERLLAEMAAAARGLDDARVILDTRRARAALPVSDLWHLAQYLAALPEIRWGKTAVVAPPEGLDDAEFFATAAQNRGLRVRAFAPFEDAVAWLTDDSVGAPR